ncbi:hypothetical protein N1851_021750 [Merluccius polli]|uniref:DUF5641 domain-containing protein n=1 Tax=Merluccius polli TaxID=89951 RepID=A0AA47MJI8_MERPO|nr:hypothetical protein N1851_021750 [Merluccius polli]
MPLPFKEERPMLPNNKACAEIRLQCLKRRFRKDEQYYKDYRTLDSSSLRTFMYEAMAIVNSRPLTSEHLNDPLAPEPLTPNHILTMKSEIIAPPPGEFSRNDLYLKKRWKRVQFLANEFWTRWKKEYLLNLQQRSKWNKNRRDTKVNDIVLLQNDLAPRNDWKIAKVVEVFPGSDGRVRKVKLLVSDATLDSKAFGARWGLGAPVGAGLAHTAAVANSVEEAAVACVTGVTARQLVAQAGLLVRDTAARGAHVPALELQGLGHLLGEQLADNKASGKDNITAEHLQLASPRVAALLSICLTGLMTHGILPDTMLTVTLVPVIKDKAALFNLYMDNLSKQLGKCKTGCLIGNTLLNHLMYADDLAIMSPSTVGFQQLLDICSEYGVEFDVQYNAKKSVVLICRTKEDQKLHFPMFYLSGQSLCVSNCMKYLGHIITDKMEDDADMYRQRRMLYVEANMLVRKFHYCSDDVKVNLFRSYCTPMYAAPLWVSYKKETLRKLQVAYNDCLRILLKKPRSSSASKLFCDSGLSTLQALLRNLMFKFMQTSQVSRKFRESPANQ